MQTVTWKSLKGVLYQLSIDDGSNTTVYLVPSAVPFITQVNNSDDFYFPVREQTGYIGVQGEVGIMENLLASSPANRPVLLTSTKNNVTSVAWKGYLQTDAFSQVWDKGPNDISLPVMSHLALISSYDLETIGYVSFADAINRMSKVTGAAFYSSFVFPNISNLISVLKYRICGQVFATYSENSQAWQYGSFRNVLEEICKVFGWVAIEQADVLCFIAPDSNAGYYSLTAAQMEALAADETPTPTSISQTAIVDSIFGNEHQIDYLPGKKSVKIIGNPSPWEMTVFSFNTNMLSRSNSQDYVSYIDTDRTEYLHILSNNFENSGFLSGIGNQQNNIKLQNFMAGNDDTWKGSCCVNEREYVTSPNENPSILRDGGWVQRIMWRTPYNYAGNTLAVITPVIQHTSTGLFSNCWLSLTGTVNKAATYKDDWTEAENPIHLKIEIGDSTVIDELVDIVEGIISKPNAQEANALVIPCNPYNGQIKITLKVASQPVILGYYDNYYSLEGLTLKYIRSWDHRFIDPATENIVSREIGGGWTDELEQTNMLTTMRPEQIGYGLILDADLQPVSVLYNSTTPEDALASRMYNHYQTAKKMITAQLEGDGAMLSPLHRHIPGSGTQMMCLSQSVDWVNEQIKAYLFEV